LQNAADGDAQSDKVAMIVGNQLTGAGINSLFDNFALLLPLVCGGLFL